MVAVTLLFYYIFKPVLDRRLSLLCGVLQLFVVAVTMFASSISTSQRENIGLGFHGSYVDP